MRFVRHKGEVYLEFTSLKDVCRFAFGCLAIAGFGLAMFYVLWILIDLLKAV